MAIGEAFLGALLQVVFDRLASRQVINFFRHSDFDHSLVDKLKTLMLAIQKLLLDAEDKQFTDAIVKQWLVELKHWFLRAEEIVDDIATETLRSSIELPPVPQSYMTKVCNLIPGLSRDSFENRVSIEMKEVIGMLENMLCQKDALGLREPSVSTARAPPQTQRVPTTCVMEDARMFGRDHERKKILDFMRSNESGRSGVGVIAIMGMGGLGKTTLAKLVYNDSTLDQVFNLRAWVCVSDDFDVQRITKLIVESILGQPYNGSPDLNFLQMKLSSVLRGKRFLVVVDDVWNEDYERWQCLRAPFNVGANGIKIIVTTRNICLIV